MWNSSLWNCVKTEAVVLFEQSKCGESTLSTVPTVLWAAGAAALAQRLISALFKRFVFRRVPVWEIVLQHLLFLWIVIYSLRFWGVFVKAVKTLIEYCYENLLTGHGGFFGYLTRFRCKGDPSCACEPGVEETVQHMLVDCPIHGRDRLELEVETRVKENDVLLEEDINSCKMMQQWLIWLCGIAPLALFIQTQPRPEVPPLMIWITTSPWQRREMGPYGYYLNRPLSSLASTTNMSPKQQALTLRRAFSDSKIIIKEPLKKKKVSKSI